MEDFSRKQIKHKKKIITKWGLINSQKKIFQVAKKKSFLSIMYLICGFNIWNKMVIIQKLKISSVKGG